MLEQEARGSSIKKAPKRYCDSESILNKHKGAQATWTAAWDPIILDGPNLFQGIKIV